MKYTTFSALTGKQRNRDGAPVCSGYHDCCGAKGLKLIFVSIDACSQWVQRWFSFPSQSKIRNMSHSLAVLATALLFGGMTLYSFAFAAFLFKALPAPVAGTMLRMAFPLFYFFVIGT